MPELPEVEAVTRRLKPVLPGARVRSVKVLRPRATAPQRPDALEAAVGRTIERIARRGKNIILDLDQQLSLRVHLGMTGNLTVIPDARLHANTVRVLFELEDGRGLVLDDRRIFGRVNLYTKQELEQRLAGLGVEPLSRDFTPELLISAAKRSRRPAKLFLMDQHPVSGLGNIYAAEALFRAGIHPERKMDSVKRPKLLKLHAGIQEALFEAIPKTIRWYRTPGRKEKMGYYVYGRADEACRVCGRKISRFEQAGRSTYFCSRCQR